MSTLSQSPFLSVLLPTYQCRGLMDRYLAAMSEWADLADEIIVIDSRSTDGTLEPIREHPRHPGLRIIERDRGLYASWNEGLAATSGRWIYISTAGETISRRQLELLLAKGDAMQADVVISPSDYVDESGRPTPKARKRPQICADFRSEATYCSHPRPSGISRSVQPGRTPSSAAAPATCSAGIFSALARSPKITAPTETPRGCYGMPTR
jgi:glycosyltransferase involved in cell wall biosynthesis